MTMMAGINEAYDVSHSPQGRPRRGPTFTGVGNAVLVSTTALVPIAIAFPRTGRRPRGASPHLRLLACERVGYVFIGLLQRIIDRLLVEQFPFEIGAARVPTLSGVDTP